MSAGRGGMWLDDQNTFDALIDDWLAAREMLGLSYDGDITKVLYAYRASRTLTFRDEYTKLIHLAMTQETELPRPPSKAVKKIVNALQQAAERGNWGDLPLH